MPLSLLPYVVVLVLGAGALAAAGWQGYKVGRDSGAADLAEAREDAGRLRLAIQRTREEADRVRAEAEKAGDRVRVEYRDRIKVIREKAPPPEIIERVMVEAADCPFVPPSLVCIWNGTAADGACPESPAGAAVTVAELAEAAAEARRRFLENQAQLDAFQQWARGVGASE